MQNVAALARTARPFDVTPRTVSSFGRSSEVSAQQSPSSTADWSSICCRALYP
jgi:hypothetical protein